MNIKKAFVVWYTFLGALLISVPVAFTVDGFGLVSVPNWMMMVLLGVQLLVGAGILLLDVPILKRVEKSISED